VQARPEVEALALIAESLAVVVGQMQDDGSFGIGDDAAVVGPEFVTGERLVVSTDSVVESVHFDLSYCSLQDVGWKALVSALSDLAAMGARPIGATIAVSGFGLAELGPLYEGIGFASRVSACPIVGGDLSGSATRAVTVTVLGQSSTPIARSGAQVGDVVGVSGVLGGSAAGLRELSVDRSSDSKLARRHRRPPLRLVIGSVLASAQVSAMIDVSDGLLSDADRLATSSGVGIVIDEVPIQQGATRQDACVGGEDYELLFAASETAFAEINERCQAAGIDVPLRIGRCVEDRAVRTVGEIEFGKAFGTNLGWQHQMQ
jgi:thiamine-monophosphate kinase